jgi:hypothetical protein
MPTTSIGGNYDDRVGIHEIEQGNRVVLAGVTPRCGQQQHVICDEAVSDASRGQAIQQSVDRRGPLDSCVFHLIPFCQNSTIDISQNFSE